MRRGHTQRSTPINSPTMPPQHLPTSAAAALLCRQPQTLRKWACGMLKAPIQPVRVGGRLLWSVAAIERLLEPEATTGEGRAQ